MKHERVATIRIERDTRAATVQARGRFLKALRKLRHPSRSEQLRSFLD